MERNLTENCLHIQYKLFCLTFTFVPYKKKKEKHMNDMEVSSWERYTFHGCQWHKCFVIQSGLQLKFTFNMSYVTP